MTAIERAVQPVASVHKQGRCEKDQPPAERAKPDGMALSGMRAGWLTEKMRYSVTEVRAELEQLLQDQLTPLRGRFKDVGIRLAPPEGVEVVPGASLLDPATLRDHVTRFGERIGTADLRIAGVHWLGQLGYALLPPIEIAMTRSGIGLDASLSNIGILQPNGQPAEIMINDLSNTIVLPERYSGSLPLAQIGTPIDSAEALRHFVLTGLFGHTFRPLIERIHDFSGVSPKVMWGQVAYEADLFFGQLFRAAPELQTAAWEEDRAAFFQRHEWDLSDGPSPLYGPTRTTLTVDPESGEEKSRTLRSTCCLIYQVPTGRMCGACPLAPKRDTVAEKRATAGERRAAHGVAVKTA